MKLTCKIIVATGAIVLFSFSLKAQNQVANPASTIHALNDALTKTLTPDGINPPLASRFYLYPNILFHETLNLAVNGELRYQNFLNRTLWLPEIKDSVSAEYLAFYAFSKVTSEMVYRPELFQELTESTRLDLINRTDKKLIIASEKYFDSILDTILRWINSDGFNEIRALPEYTPLEESWSWEPTPPNYVDALEPNWGQLKLAFLADTIGLVLKPKIQFDTVPQSEFHNAAMDVYRTVNQATEEQTTIAKHWDCNPLQTHADGHFMYSSKQMTPGGHWMGIAGIVSQNSNLNLLKTSEVYTNIAIALHEGFIVSWQTKYRHHLIRPETYINRHIDPNWRPILETPPFPEYTSAHSVISMASAMILTAHFGDMAFIDTMEVQYRLPIREFSSFTTAAKEVSESRVYGGIHYRFGVNDGMSQGALIADRLIERFGIKPF